MNLPMPAPARAILSDLLCTPVAMWPDRFFAVVRELAEAMGGGANSPREYVMRQQIAALQAKGETGKTTMPWDEPIYSIEAGLAKVNVAGPLVKGYDAFTCWYWGLMSTDRLQAAILEIGERADVTDVLFRFNTPGGMSTGMPETADLIVALGETKNTVGFTSDLACSNGMRLLAACGTAIATRSALVGCIGTYIALYDYCAYLEEMGIKLELFRAGRLKGIGVPGKELTEEERKFLQGSVEENNAIFTGFIRARREGVEDETMQGQWFSGEKGAELGLVDLVVTTEEQVIGLLRAHGAGELA